MITDIKNGKNSFVVTKFGETLYISTVYSNLISGYESVVAMTYPEKKEVDFNKVYSVERTATYSEALAAHSKLEDKFKGIDYKLDVE